MSTIIYGHIVTRDCVNAKMRWQKSDIDSDSIEKKIIVMEQIIFYNISIWFH